MIFREQRLGKPPHKTEAKLIQERDPEDPIKKLSYSILCFEGQSQRTKDIIISRRNSQEREKKKLPASIDNGTRWRAWLGISLLEDPPRKVNK